MDLAVSNPGDFFNSGRFDFVSRVLESCAGNEDLTENDYRTITDVYRVAVMNRDRVPEGFVGKVMNYVQNAGWGRVHLGAGSEREDEEKTVTQRRALVEVEWDIMDEVLPGPEVIYKRSPEFPEGHVLEGYIIPRQVEESVTIRNRYGMLVVVDGVSPDVTSLNTTVDEDLPSYI